ncbi:MAG: hypothetical protein ACKOFW_08875, partial [Planctomycetaceae bacterium]
MSNSPGSHRLHSTGPGPREPAISTPAVAVADHALSRPAPRGWRGFGGARAGRSRRAHACATGWGVLVLGLLVGLVHGEEAGPGDRVFAAPGVIDLELTLTPEQFRGLTPTGGFGPPGGAIPESDEAK